MQKQTLRYKVAAFGVAVSLCASLAPSAHAAPQTSQRIDPIGFNLVDGKQDTAHPLTDDALISDVGYSSTSPDFGNVYTEEGVIGVDDRQAVDDAKQAPFRWIGFLNFKVTSGKSASCTASLIAPDAVITSAHCVADGFNNFSFTPGQNGDSKPYGTVEATQIWRDEKWNGDEDIEYDWAVVKLAKPIGNELGWFGMRSVSNERLNGKPVFIVGYPYDKPKSTMWVSFGTTYREDRGTFTHNTDSQPGNSGSPVMDQNGTIYGIHFGGNDFESISTRLTNNIFNAVVNIGFTPAQELGQ